MINLDLFGAKLCWAAYEGGITVGDHSIFAQEGDDYIDIAFAGTANLENILEDVYVSVARTPAGYLAHAGVVQTWEELRYAVQDHLCKKKSPRFHGHSLGGGTARMFAEQYNAELITYGALCTYPKRGPYPRLRERRWVCDDDPVPLVPGIFFNQKCPGRVLQDNDHRILELKDHSIDVYINRLEKYSP